MVCHDRDVGGKHRGEAGVVALHLNKHKTMYIKIAEKKNCKKLTEVFNKTLEHPRSAGG
jgi:hypothetical protein